MARDYPVAEVIKGYWGDDYPAIRYVESDGMVNTAVEAYMEQITYGNVSEDQAMANRAFITCAPTDILALIEEVERLRRGNEH